MNLDYKNLTITIEEIFIDELFLMRKKGAVVQFELVREAKRKKERKNVFTKGEKSIVAVRTLEVVKTCHFSQSYKVIKDINSDKP